MVLVCCLLLTINLFSLFFFFLLSLAGFKLVNLKGAENKHWYQRMFLFPEAL